MASGKRASMREGPLAALFRRTEEDATESGGEGRPAGREGEETPERREGTPAARGDRPPEPATAAAREREGAGEPEPPAPPEAGATPERSTVPTPRERLRHAFASDIPDNVMDATTAAGTRTAPTAPEPTDAYARPGAEVY